MAKPAAPEFDRIERTAEAAHNPSRVGEYRAILGKITNSKTKDDAQGLIRELIVELHTCIHDQWKLSAAKHYGVKPSQVTEFPKTVEAWCSELECTSGEVPATARDLYTLLNQVEAQLSWELTHNDIKGIATKVSNVLRRYHEVKPEEKVQERPERDEMVKEGTIIPAIA